ncbi:hypothetical protein JMJ77_0005228, partial [Colletotrichum scovillei]
RERERESPEREVVRYLCTYQIRTSGRERESSGVARREAKRTWAISLQDCQGPYGFSRNVRLGEDGGNDCVFGEKLN